MCGIIGVFNKEEAAVLVKQGLAVMQDRGRDGCGIIAERLQTVKHPAELITQDHKNCLGHLLHSIVGFVPQPLKGAGWLSANCEIYNWQELNRKYGWTTENDASTLLHLIDKKGVEQAIKELDGVFAFAYWADSKLYLARDLLGVKPVWYAHTDGFAFASEKKVLEAIGYLHVEELNPRSILCYDLSANSLSFVQRNFLTLEDEDKRTLAKVKEKVTEFLVAAVKKRIPEAKFGLLFSGGLDSSLLALICKKLKADFTCYTAAVEGDVEAEDVVYARKAAEALGLKLEIVSVPLGDVEMYLKRVVPLIEDSNVVKVGVALPFFVACEKARKDGVRVLFTGLGSEELFGGYRRHKFAKNINLECLSGLLKMYERDLYRDDVITMNNNIELREPFLDQALAACALRISGKYKIRDGVEKWVLRAVAEEMGLPPLFAWRKKKAAQYGSRFDKALEKLSRKKKHPSKSAYLRTFYPQHNVKLAALVSGGKDSLYAAYTMQRQNYEICCLVTLKSVNPHSYMFHTPNVHLVEMQAKAMGVPLVERETKGEKEAELLDLKEVLLQAKQQYGVQGVVTGALASQYQRERIEKICDALGLKIFAPLWHINQETYLRELVAHDFKVIITAVAADGLDKTFLGGVLDQEMIEKLLKVNRKTGINVAFEGGEAESLVIDCPPFREALSIKEAEIVEDGKHAARMQITRVVLEKKRNYDN
ncbi:diphthine--ammonia ligase [Candidatus Woesearchaeota archaeon]|nr:diphthine--ammonia ligase [Candidatus Woesearchaeota archaeon]